MNERTCKNCKHVELSFSKYPCIDCDEDYDKWETAQPAVDAMESKIAALEAENAKMRELINKVKAVLENDDTFYNDIQALRIIRYWQEHDAT